MTLVADRLLAGGIDVTDDPAALGTPPISGRPLMLVDLFNDGDVLASHLCAQIAEQHWLDAFLLAAGVHQISEDRWQRDRLGLRRAGAILAQMEGRGAHLVGTVASRVDRYDLWARSHYPGEPRRREQARHLAWLVHELCRAALHLGTDPDPKALHGAARSLQDSLGTGLGDGNDVVRLPSCFRSFDQRLEDVVELASSFAERWPDRHCPLTVVGARTSGSYLAPVATVALEHLGYSDVTTATVRPGWPMSTQAQADMLRCSRAGGMVIVIDDPPATGASIAAVVGQVRAAGRITDDRVVVLVALSPDSDLGPGQLGGAPVVSLPWEQWAVHQQLTPDRVAEAVTHLLAPGTSARRAELVGPPTRPERGHVQARYRLELVDASSDDLTTATIAVEGVGVGYLGRHAIAVAQAMPGLVPDVFGFNDGLLYRKWLPEGSEPSHHGHERQQVTTLLTSVIAGYVAERQRALHVPADRSLVLSGRQPAWEVASRIVSRSLGPLALPLRIPIVDPLTRHLLQPAKPSIVDGTTAVDRWFIGTDEGGRKVDFAEGPFSHVDLATYDAVFDLAGAAVSSKSSSLAASLRAAYEAQTGTPIDPERWMLHRLVHVWNGNRLGGTTPAVADRLGSQIVQSYFAERLLDDLPSPTTGPFAALDLDGVLETSPLGFPATTLSGALALRALRAHGVGLLLVTGRSLSEVIERCDSYGAVGGVAEYGAVIYDHAHGSVTDLVAAEDAAAAEHLRASAATLATVEVDGDYRRIVRTFERGPDGRRGLDPDVARWLAGAVSAVGTRPRLNPVFGEMQTDFIPAGTDKGRGLRALLDQLGDRLGHQRSDGAPGTSRRREATTNPVTLAIGDALTDASFLGLSDRAFAPANGEGGLELRGVEILPASYQSGLGQAVARVLGHRPGSCPICRAPDLPEPARDLLALLSVQENGRRGAPLRLTSIAARALLARALR